MEVVYSIVIITIFIIQHMIVVSLVYRVYLCATFTGDDYCSQPAQNVMETEIGAMLSGGGRRTERSK